MARPRLVELAEAKLRGAAIDPADVTGELAGLLDQPGGERIDTVVLACTHFPLLAPELAAAAPRPLAFVEGGEGIARRVAHLLADSSALAAGQTTTSSASPAASRAVFTRRDADVDALRPALHSVGLNTVEFL